MIFSISKLQHLHLLHHRTIPRIQEYNHLHHKRNQYNHHQQHFHLTALLPNENPNSFIHYRALVSLIVYLK